jgi:hypothetical protein
MDSKMAAYIGQPRKDSTGHTLPTISKTILNQMKDYFKSNERLFLNQMKDYFQIKFKDYFKIK